MADVLLTTYEEINQLLTEQTGYSLRSYEDMMSFIEEQCNSKVIFISAVYDSYKTYSQLFYIHKSANDDPYSPEYMDISLDDISITNDSINDCLNIKNLSDNVIFVNYIQMTNDYNEETGEYDLYSWYNYYVWNNYTLYPDESFNVISSNISSYTISEPFMNLKYVPTMDEAVDMYRDLMTDISDAIKETIGLKPDTMKLETWLYNTPRQYTWSKYRNYTYRDDAKEDIVNECIKSLESYDYNAYSCSITINYYETGPQSSSSTVCYLDIYKNTMETRSSSNVKTYLCRYRLTINSSDTDYPKYIGINEKITENIQPITAYGVSFNSEIYNKQYESTSLIVPKNTIKPYEFAKTILGSGEDSNHYNYRWILRDTANAIRSVSGSSDQITALDIPDAIRNLNNS